VLGGLAAEQDADANLFDSYFALASAEPLGSLDRKHFNAPMVREKMIDAAYTARAV
jgi:hypothetical protein